MRCGVRQVGKAYGYNRGRGTLPLLVPRNQQRAQLHTDAAEEAQQAEATFAAETFYASVKALAKLQGQDTYKCQAAQINEAESALANLNLQTGNEVGHPI